MKENKFRAWDKKKKVFILVHLGMTFGKEGMKDKVFMQFIGLKDKNGKEIYEGDIVLEDKGTEPIYGVVVFEREDARFAIEDKINDEVFLFNYDIDGEDLKIIGNIYENPELLKESTNEE